MRFWTCYRSPPDHRAHAELSAELVASWSREVHRAVTSSMPTARNSLATVTVPGNVRAQERVIMTDFLTALLVKVATELLENLLIRLGRALFAGFSSQATA